MQKKNKKNDALSQTFFVTHLLRPDFSEVLKNQKTLPGPKENVHHFKESDSSTFLLNPVVGFLEHHY